MAPLSTILTATALLALATGHPLARASSGSPPFPTSGRAPSSVAQNTSLAYSATALPGTGYPSRTTAAGASHATGTSKAPSASTGTATPSGAASPFVGTGTINVVVGSDSKRVGCLDDDMRVIPVPVSAAQPIDARDGPSSSAALPAPAPTIVGSSSSYAPATITTTPLQSSASAPAPGGDAGAPSSIGGDSGALAGLPSAGSLAPHASLQTFDSFSRATSAPATATAPVSIALAPGPLATPSNGPKTCATFTGAQAQPTGAITLSTAAGECGAIGSGKAPALACGTAKGSSRASARGGFRVANNPLGRSTAVLCEDPRGACAFATNATIGTVPAAIHGSAAGGSHAMRLTWAAVEPAEL